MTKVLVLYYSSYGHIERMADAVAEGAREGGAEVDVRERGEQRVVDRVEDEFEVHPRGGRGVLDVDDGSAFGDA